MILALTLAAATATAAPAPSTREFYLRAIDAMSGLPQPQYVTYRMVGTSENLPMKLSPDKKGNLWLGIGGGSDHTSWSIRHRTFDYRSVVTNDEDGTSYVTVRSFFDPTWYGTERALRKGMLDSQDEAPPRTAHATQQPSPPVTLKTIAVTSVMGPSIYEIEDRGAATCANGAAGHALHLYPRDRSAFHQLSDVVVELRTMRFCMMRYSVSDAFGFHGIVEQHFADVGGYWMQTDGLLDGTLRIFGIAGRHGIWRYRLEEMRFPSTIDVGASIEPQPLRPLHA